MKEKNKKKELARTSPETFNPFGMMRRFTEDMEHLFENFGGFNAPGFFNREFFPFREEFERVEWMPQIEVTRKNGDLKVRADLPGLTKDDVKVELTEEALTITGERQEEKEEKGEGFYSSERSYGHFYRQIPLPEGAKTEKATATFTHGVLEITMPVPKALAPETRKLEIKEANPEKKQAKTATA